MPPATHPRTALLLLAALAGPLAGAVRASGPPQEPAPRDTLVSLRVLVRRDTVPLAAAVVRSGNTSSVTDRLGQALLRLTPGRHTVVAAKIGFVPESLAIVLRPGADTAITLQLTWQPAELEGIVVSATRSERRIEDEPVRVEVLTQEEVEEKLRMTPGDITMLLNESAGLRVQTTSPSLGGANLRIQGLRGRYTQILADGLPLYGGQTGGLGLLQIPPMDLRGVEVVKGVASALYGGSALGGVINLISRNPGPEPATDLLLNQTTLEGSDAVGFASARLSDRWSYTLLAGAHRQSRVDKDGDGWTDLAGYRRGLLRPRLFWSDSQGHSLMLTAGATLEQREGGTLDAATAPDGVPYAEALRTQRFDAGGLGRFLLGGTAALSLRGAVVSQGHRHTFGPLREHDRHLTWFGEAAFSTGTTGSFWVIGAALQQERYRARDVPGFDYTFTTPALFAQNTFAPAAWLALTASARLDHHNEYGVQFSPRLSVLFRAGPRWSVRASAGTGFFAPTPFTEETEVIGLTPLAPLANLRAEQARSGSLDLGGALGPLELNATLFGSVIEHPLGLRALSLVNLERPARTVGTELLLRWKPVPFHLTASYTLVRSTEQDPETGARRDAPLTPHHQAGLVGAWEQEGEARIGLELYYTGRQPLDDNPYRSWSKPYLHIGVLAERRFGRFRIFLNGENLLGFRQTKYDPLVLPSRGPGGRWTTDVWGPLEGRVANLGVRIDAR